MRRLHIAISAIFFTSLTFSGASATPSFTVEFAGPASVSGNLTAETTWAIIEMAPGSTAILTSAGSAGASVHYTNFTWTEIDNGRDHVEVQPVVTQSQQSRSFSRFEARWPAGGYLGIRSTNLVVEITNVNVELAILEPDRLQIHTNPANPDWYTPWPSDSSTSSIYLETSKAPLGNAVVRGSEGVYYELLGAIISCQTDWCPTGGKIESSQFGPVTTNTVNFERIGPLSGALEYVGSPARLLTGAAQISSQLDGKIRLPRAIPSGACSCGLDGNETLGLSGVVTLDQVRPMSNGRIQTKVQGASFNARVDEGYMSPTLLLGVQAASAVGAFVFVAVVKFLFIPLFTRLSKQQALEHPKRQRIFAYIQEHPGANFREVSRETGIAAGTVRHHLTVLERAGHIVEHAHQGTIRLFENHGKFDATWVDAVLLREPPLAQLHAWLKEHPSVPQKDALEAMELQGWSRSTTQHRLARLVAGGVLTLRLQGRLKIYSVSDPQTRKAPGLLASGLAGHWSTNANASQV